MLAINAADGRQLAHIQEAEAAGFRLNVQFNNLTNSTDGRARSGPVTDDAAYESALAADLDATHPQLVTIQNEEDGLQFWSGTPRDYLHELADAVHVAHAKGYEISNGGVSAGGVKLAYWHHLWISGQRAAADAFARSSLGPGVSRVGAIAGDLPGSARSRPADLRAHPADARQAGARGNPDRRLSGDRDRLRELPLVRERSGRPEGGRDVVEPDDRPSGDLQ